MQVERFKAGGKISSRGIRIESDGAVRHDKRRSNLRTGYRKGVIT